MAIFSSIKQTILGSDAEAGEAQGSEAATARDAQIHDQTTGQRSTGRISVENSLDSMPGADRLNWRTSIVDLMKLIGVDSSYDARRALARELGREDYSDTPADNVWLHKRTMRALAESGGSVPPDILA